jgi:5-methylcytosine-specific restriction endonuclease McrA
MSKPSTQGRPIKGVWSYAPPKDAVNARRKANRPYSHAERLEHRRLLAEYVAEHGWVCPLCKRETDDLEVDHEKPYAKGADAEGGPKRVICGRCNQRRGARMQKYLRGAWGTRGLKGVK